MTAFCSFFFSNHLYGLVISLNHQKKTSTKTGFLSSSICSILSQFSLISRMNDVILCFLMQLCKLIHFEYFFLIDIKTKYTHLHNLENFHSYFVKTVCAGKVFYLFFCIRHYYIFFFFFANL